MTTDTFIDWALHTGIAVTLLTAFILLIRRPFAQRFGAGAAYTLWALPLIRLLMPPVTLPVLKPETMPVTIITQMPPSAPPQSSLQIESTATALNFAPFILGAWLSITVLWLAREALRQHRYVHKLRAQSTPINGPCALLAQKAMGAAKLKTLPDIRFSTQKTGPLVTGLRRPMIILPENFETHFHPQQQYFALLHEMTHIKRRDLWAAFGVLLFRALNWPNPLIHFAAHKFRADQEAACDASVLKLIGANRNAHAYAETLVHAAKSVIHSNKEAPLGLTIYHPLKERLMMIKTNSAQGGRLARLAAGSIVLAIGVAAAPITLAAGPDTTEMAGKAEVKTKSKKVIKSTEEIDGKTVKTHYEIITDDNGTKAYSIDERGARTEVDPDSIKMKGGMKMSIHGQGMASQDLLIMEDIEGPSGQQKIKIVTKSGHGGPHMDQNIETVISEGSRGQHVIVKKMTGGTGDSDKHVKVYKFSSENDFEMDFDGDAHGMENGVHTKAMVSAASGLLDGVNEDELSDKAKRKIAKARKALKEAEKALEDEK